MLEISGAIWIQGPKWCGKSTTAKTFSKSNIELQNNQTLELIKLQISNNSNHFLEKVTPILIDEWQEIPEILDLIRLEVDKRNKNGQFILTGSKTPDTTKIHHSGIGRIKKSKWVHFHCLNQMNLQAKYLFQKFWIMSKIIIFLLVKKIWMT